MSDEYSKEFIIFAACLMDEYQDALCRHHEKTKCPIKLAENDASWEISKIKGLVNQAVSRIEEGKYKIDDL